MDALNYNSILEQDCCLNIRKASRNVTAMFDEQFWKIGISSGQFSILLTLISSVEKSVSSLAKSLLMDRTTLSRGLKHLLKLGLIEKAIDHFQMKDARAKVYIVTQAGKEKLDLAIPLWDEMQKDILGEYGEVHYDLLIDNLIALNDVIKKVK